MKAEQLKKDITELLDVFYEDDLDVILGKIESYTSEIAKEAFPNIKKNDTEICGKCGTVI